jgi:rare lipoprotein A (peptidoglycan hydrolase)
MSNSANKGMLETLTLLGMIASVSIHDADIPHVKPEPLKVTYVTKQVTSYRSIGCADVSWYGPGFNGNTTANGEVFNQDGISAAHKDLPFGTMLRVTNQENGRSVIVRINDRGPYAPGRFVDLSKGAAEVIGSTHRGVVYGCADIVEKRWVTIPRLPGTVIAESGL